jgi:signal transduction histidine kinase
MKINIHQRLLLFSFITLAGVGLMGYAAYKSNQKLLDSEQWVEHSEQVIYQAGYIISLSKDIETASWGFVITKDSTFLGRLYNAEKTIFAYIGQLRQLTLDNPKQQKRIDSLDFFMHKRIAFSKQTVELRSKQGLASAIAYISTKQGQKYSEHLHQITNDIQEEEGTLLKQRKQANKSSTETFNRFAEIMFLLMLVFTILLVLSAVKHLRQNKDKEKRADELVIANRELVFQNDEKEKRAAELVIANEELAFQNEEKGKRAAELTVANVELVFQNQEKENRAAELVIVNDEVAFQNKEKEKRAKEAALEKIANQKEITEAVIAAQENERSEIGRELHDNINQLLAASKLFNNMGKTGDKDHDALLDTSSNYTMQAIEEIRKLTKILITPLIKEIGLSKSINEVAEDIMLVNPLKIKLLIKDFDEGILNEKFKVNLFRIIQEQIINTLKHSKAEILKIELSQTNDNVFIGISDDGVGFDTSQRRKGVGILNIRSRAEKYKGNVVINSAPGKGCSLSVSFKKTDLLLD